MSDLFHDKVSFSNRKYRLPQIDVLRGIDTTIRYEDNAWTFVSDPIACRVV